MRAVTPQSKQASATASVASRRQRMKWWVLCSKPQRQTLPSSSSFRARQQMCSCIEVTTRAASGSCGRTRHKEVPMRLWKMRLPRLTLTLKESIGIATAPMRQHSSRSIASRLPTCHSWNPMSPKVIRGVSRCRLARDSALCASCSKVTMIAQASNIS